MMVAMLLSFQSVHAYDFAVDGINYDITSFTELLVTATSVSDLVEGEIIVPSSVSYNGKNLSVVAIGNNFAIDNQKVTMLQIGDGVTDIGSFAFAGCSNLSSIEIPESTVNIGANAFANCASIREVNAFGVETLGENCFSDCASIEQAAFPKLTEIPAFAFSGCKSLRSVDIATTKKIGNSSFAGCAFISFEVPSSVTKIESNAFVDCHNLESFVIPNNVSEIATGLFKNCTSLKEVTIGSGVTSLPWLFENCQNLEKLRIEDSKSELVFEYCGNRSFSDGTKGHPINYTSRDYTPVASMFQNTSLKQVYIGRDLTTEAFCYKSVYMSGSYDGRYYYYIPNPPFSSSNILKLEIGPLVTDFKMCNSKSSGYREYVHGSWNGAFQNCYDLAEVDIKSSASTITDNSFAECQALQNIIIPNNVKSLGKNVFQNCIALTSIDLGCYLTSIGNNAFAGDTSLSSISLRSSNPPTYPTGFSSSEYINTMVNVPSGSLEDYKNTEPWMNFWNLNESQDLISLFEVDGIIYLVSSKNNVQIVGQSLTATQDLVISSSVTYSGVSFRVSSISDNAFKGCLMIESLEIAEGIVYIGNNAFEGCNNLKEVSLPASLSSIGDGAFKNCAKLLAINLPKPIENIPSECFYGCSSLSNFSFEGVISIGDSSFFDCDGFSKVSITPSVQKIGAEAFRACSNLKELVIEDSNSYIEFPCGSYDGATSVQKKEVNGKTIQFKIQYYNGYFSGLPIEKLHIGRNLSDKSRYTISGDGGVDYYLITSYDTPFSSLSKLKELEIADCVSILGPKEEYISEVDLYSTSGSFKNCSNIEKVTVRNEEPPTGVEFSSNTYAKAKLIVPDNTVPLYQVADGWKEFISILDESSAGTEAIEIDSECPFRIDSNGVVSIGETIIPISIYNVDGRLLYDSTLHPEETVPLNSGIYIIRLSNQSYKIKI